MSGQTPVERAAEAISHPGVRGMCDKGCECEDDLALTRWVARRALAAALDVDELAAVLQQATDDGADRTEDYALAVVAHLTKGNENDE